MNEYHVAPRNLHSVSLKSKLSTVKHAGLRAVAQMSTQSQTAFHWTAGRRNAVQMNEWKNTNRTWHIFTALRLMLMHEMSGQHSERPISFQEMLLIYVNLLYDMEPYHVIPCYTPKDLIILG